MLSLLFISITTSLAISQAEVPAGTFEYSGKYKIESHKRFEKVDTRSPDGKSRLDELIYHKYDCLQKMMSIYECSKFLPPGRIDPEFIAKNLNTKYQTWKLDLQPPASQPTLDYKSETYELWISPQFGKFLSKDYLQIYYANNSSFYKLLLKDALGKTENEFVVSSKETLLHANIFNQQIGNVRDSFLIMAEFN